MSQSVKAIAKSSFGLIIVKSMTSRIIQKIVFINDALA